MIAAAAICVIDDDAAVVRALSRLLRTYAYDVRTFASAQEFLDSGPDGDDAIGCLVVDVHMPGISGFELQAILQAVGRLLPVVFVTGAGDAKLRCRALAYGAVELLEKPFADADLIRAVQLALEPRQTAALIDN
jgi:FixJ family two-component response regulator